MIWNTIFSGSDAVDLCLPSDIVVVVLFSTSVNKYDAYCTRKFEESRGCFVFCEKSLETICWPLPQSHFCQGEFTQVHEGIVTQFTWELRIVYCAHNHNFLINNVGTQSTLGHFLQSRQYCRIVSLKIQRNLFFQRVVFRPKFRYTLCR